MAARRQSDGRNPGARGRRRAPDPDRADPADAGKAIRPVRWRDRAGAVRTAALAVLGQPQAHRLHGDLSLSADIYAVAGRTCAEALSQAYRRLSVDPRSAHAEECIRD